MENPPKTESQIALEERIAHLERICEDLSDILAEQTRKMAVMERLTRQLVEREAERDAAGGASVPLADQRPPHW